MSGPTKSSWSRPQTVQGFATSQPNAVLVRYVEGEVARVPRLRVLDLGCGAARNAVPMAKLGCWVLGTDTAWPMLEAARGRAEEEGVADRLHLTCATMDALPVASGSVDLIVAHGIWNLARSGREFRTAVRDAARAARPGAGLFLFTFSRHTLPPDVEPVTGETFVFTQFSGEPQCFLTEAQVIEELDAAGFVKEPPGPLSEYNRPTGKTLMGSGPVIFEGTFRRRG
jgi:SAM-dependent methyltransferase